MVAIDFHSGTVNSRHRYYSSVFKSSVKILESINTIQFVRINNIKLHCDKCDVRCLRRTHRFLTIYKYFIEMHTNFETRVAISTL